MAPLGQEAHGQNKKLLSLPQPRVARPLGQLQGSGNRCSARLPGCRVARRGEPLGWPGRGRTSLARAFFFALRASTVSCWQEVIRLWLDLPPSSAVGPGGLQTKNLLFFLTDVSPFYFSP